MPLSTEKVKYTNTVSIPLTCDDLKLYTALIINPPRLLHLASEVILCVMEYELHLLSLCMVARYMPYLLELI